MDSIDPVPILEPPSSPPTSSAPRPSNPSLSPQRPAGRKPRGNPSVTPRKFRKFFTPRSHGTPSGVRQPFHDITGPALNRNGVQSSPLRPFEGIGGMDSDGTSFPRDMKRRKMMHTPEQASEHQYGSPKEIGFLGIHDMENRQDDIIPSSPCERAMKNIDEVEEEEEEVEEPEPVQKKPLKRIVPLSSRGLAGELLCLSLRGSSGTGRQHCEYPLTDWRDHTAGFYSRPEDMHDSTSIEGPNRVIPFCVDSCNTNSLVAIGDEEGRVRLLESAKDGKPAFKDVFLAFRVHTNAIIDMSFSDDDSLLATASGDQSARVVDMNTQTTISILGHHSSSLKQVRWQPSANKSILATSSRDGSIQIWDLRCKGYGPSHEIFRPIDTGRPTTRSVANQIHYGIPINGIYDAHKPQYRQNSSLNPTDTPSRGEGTGRIGDVSVTSIQFLPAGQDHLILSASEADSSVKLWDIRAIQTKRKTSIPLSATQQPQSHNKWRHFGISSLNLNGDGSRLYTLCKDNTVYAYSTAHLLLGHTPEYSALSQPRSFSKGTQQGLGPLYGFRHPQFLATSFYVKSAVRKAKEGKCEMLAIGSSDGCAILFPTDERYFPKSQPSSDTPTSSFSSAQTPTQSQTQILTPSRTNTRNNARLEDEIPISTNGTPLIRGHDREVGALSWTSEGELVTVGDDFLVRVWREGGDDAWDLRTGGEGEGRRWECGWADMGARFEGDEV